MSDNHTVHIYAPTHQILENEEDIRYTTFGAADVSDSYWSYICSRSVQIDRPSREVIVPQQVAVLKAALTQIDLKAAQAKNDLNEQIANLLAISYESEAA